MIDASKYEGDAAVSNAIRSVAKFEDGVTGILWLLLLFVVNGCQDKANKLNCTFVLMLSVLIPMELQL